MAGRAPRQGGIITPEDRLTIRTGRSGVEEKLPSTEVRSAEVITATHPLFRKYSRLWEKTIDLAEGENLPQYIHRHARESEEAWKMRQQRTSFRNFVDPILSLNVAYLFSKPITREPSPSEQNAEDGEEAPVSGGANVLSLEDARRRRTKVMEGRLADEWKQFLYDVDRQGNSIDRFMRKAAFWALAFGHVIGVVDMPRIDRAPTSKAEQDQMGLQPYFALYLPTALVNWEVDRENRFKWIRFQEPITDDVGPFDPKAAAKGRIFMADAKVPTGTLFSGGDPDRIRLARPARALYRTFTREKWILQEVNNSRLIERGEGMYPPSMRGVVPAVPIFNRQRARFPVIGRSEVHDIVGLNQDILNLDSLITEAIYQQVLNILVMRRQQNPQKEIIIGPENVLTFTGDQPPFFITPSTAPLQFMEQRIQGLIQEIYRLAKFSGGSAMQVRSGKSVV